MALQGFDKEYYLEQKLAALQADPSLGGDWAGKSTADLEAYFGNVGLTAEEHYRKYGWGEDLNPNRYFDADQYVANKAQSLVKAGQYATIDEAKAAFEQA